VALAERAEVALAGRAGGVGSGVVDLGGEGLGAAAGGAAAVGAGADQVLEFPAGGVAVLAAAEIASCPGDRLGGGVQPGQERGEAGRAGVAAVVGGGAGGAGGGRVPRAQACAIAWPSGPVKV
jgi:hypothetical protein